MMSKSKFTPKPRQPSNVAPAPGSRPVTRHAVAPNAAPIRETAMGPWFAQGEQHRVRVNIYRPDSLIHTHLLNRDVEDGIAVEPRRANQETARDDDRAPPGQALDERAVWSRRHRHHQQQRRRADQNHRRLANGQVQTVPQGHALSDQEARTEKSKREQDGHLARPAGSGSRQQYGREEKPEEQSAGHNRKSEHEQQAQHLREIGFAPTQQHRRGNHSYSPSTLKRLDRPIHAVTLGSEPDPRIRATPRNW